MIRKDERDKVRIVITCDGCGYVRRDQDGQRAKFRPNKVVWQEAMNEGWTAKERPQDHDWDHFCPTCSGAPAMSATPA